MGEFNWDYEIWFTQYFIEQFPIIKDYEICSVTLASTSMSTYHGHLLGGHFLCAGEVKVDTT